MGSITDDYPSPLQGYEDCEPLSDERNEDGKSLKNPPSHGLSKAYEEFTEPLDSGRRGGFDLHIYFLRTQPSELTHATQLHARIRHEFPELRIYALKPDPIGPHPVGMFEVNVFTPAQLGALVSWLVVYRGPLSVLVHPNTARPGEGERDHTERAIWMGKPYPLQVTMLRKFDEKERAEAAAEAGAMKA